MTSIKHNQRLCQRERCPKLKHSSTETLLIDGRVVFPSILPLTSSNSTLRPVRNFGNTTNFYSFSVMLLFFYRLPLICIKEIKVLPFLGSEYCVMELPPCRIAPILRFNLNTCDRLPKSEYI